MKKVHPAIIVVAAIIVVGIGVAIIVDGTRSGSGTTSAVTTSSGGASTTPTDPAVADLQTVMKRLGYYSGPIDGVYGPATSAAVTEMQKALGVTADGIFGPTTDAALKGKGHDVVVQIQTELANYGYYAGPIDGDYGTATKAAVEQLQKDLGLTADGLVGAQTVDAFNKAVADGTLTPSTTTTSSTTTSSTSTSTQSGTTATTSTTTSTTSTTTTTT
jgi:peptidoglycan hydrolase-like protein with peptidoglycan-binding domain